VALNGVPLEFIGAAKTELPPLAPARRPGGGALSLPALSYGFVVLPEASAAACKPAKPTLKTDDSASNRSNASATGPQNLTSGGGGGCPADCGLCPPAFVSGACCRGHAGNKVCRRAAVLPLRLAPLCFMSGISL
jgi:hypothetical protein